MPLVRPVALAFFRRLIRLFFRQIEIVDAPVGEVRGRLLAASHPSGLVDPILVMTAIEAPLSPIAKSTLWRVPLLRWLLDVAEAVPVARKKDAGEGALGVDNDRSFDQVAAHLARGGNVLIFPEGVSHAEPHLMPLKTGAARMLLRAHAQGARASTFQAVAIELDARETFRSRALVLHGPVRSVAAIVDDAAIAPDDRARAITATIADDLAALTLEAATAKERDVMARASALFAASLADANGSDASLTTWSEIARRASRARRGAGAAGDAMFDAVATHVEAYFQALSAAGATDAQISGVRDPSAASAASLALSAPFAIVGAALWAVPYQLPKLATAIARGERDVVSTYKIAIGLVAFPAWAIVVVALAAIIGGPRAAVVALALVIATPLPTIAWLDRIDRVGGLFPRSIDATTRAGLASLRAEALSAIERARAFVEAHERGEIRSPRASA